MERTAVKDKAELQNKLIKAEARVTELERAAELIQSEKTATERRVAEAVYPGPLP